MYIIHRKPKGDLRNDPKFFKLKIGQAKKQKRGNSEQLEK